MSQDMPGSELSFKAQVAFGIGLQRMVSFIYCFLKEDGGLPRVPLRCAVSYRTGRKPPCTAV